MQHNDFCVVRRAGEASEGGGGGGAENSRTAL